MLRGPYGGRAVRGREHARRGVWRCRRCVWRSGRCRRCGLRECLQGCLRGCQRRSQRSLGGPPAPLRGATRRSCPALWAASCGHVGARRHGGGVPWHVVCGGTRSVMAVGLDVGPKVGWVVMNKYSQRVHSGVAPAVCPAEKCVSTRRFFKYPDALETLTQAPALRGGWEAPASELPGASLSSTTTTSPSK
jgi:hypothetical protein